MANDYLPDCGVHGSATLLANLLRHFNPDDYVVMRGPLIRGEVTDLPPELRHRRSVMPFPPRHWRGQRWLRPLQIFATIAQGLWLARKYRPKVIWANFPYEHNVIAAYYVSRLSGVPLHVYMHDLWEENRAGSDRRLAHFFEGDILKHAQRVYAITSRARDHYVAKYRLKDVKVLAHAVDHSSGRHAGETPVAGAVRDALNSGRAILFVGGVYWMNRDALANLIEALRLYGRGRVKLIMLTDRSPAFLKDLGVWSDDIVLAKVSRDDVVRACAQADVLFLPLTFEPGGGEAEISTVFPTKCLEYFLSDRPILCHAPAYSYVADEIRQKGWAHLVDTRDPAALWAGIEKLLGDRAYADRVVANARSAANDRDSELIAAELQQWLLEGDAPAAAIPLREAVSS